VPKSDENSIIYADTTKCVGCRQCELACAQAHSDCSLIEARAKGYELISRIRVIQVDSINVPMQCRQCEDAPCAHACPTGAIFQKDGIVRINEKQCVGCKICVMACPFGAIEVSREGYPAPEGVTNQGTAKKCNLCEHRNHPGKEPVCGCVEACPTHALKVIKLTEYRKRLMLSRAREIAHNHSMYEG